VNRWVLAYAPLIEKRLRAFRKPPCGSIRVDETYIKVRGQWRYLYRAIDKHGTPVDFLLTAKRDLDAAKRFFRKACVDAPSGARRIFGQLRRGIGCCHVSGLCCGGSQAAGPYGSSWIRSTSLKRARSALPSPGSPDPASPTFAPYLSFDLLTPSTASRPPTAYAATAGAR
jgi:hypothetical protein